MLLEIEPPFLVVSWLWRDRLPPPHACLDKILA